jgi:hypothetical protein
MTISDLVPNLQPMVEQLSQQLRFICYFVLTAAIVPVGDFFDESVRAIGRSGRFHGRSPHVLSTP